MFKRSNRAKMLALVSALGTVGSNINSNAGAANIANIANKVSSASKVVPFAAGAMGGLLAGIIGMGVAVKYTDFGKKLAYSNDFKKFIKIIEVLKLKYFEINFKYGKASIFNHCLNDKFAGLNEKLFNDCIFAMEGMNEETFKKLDEKSMNNLKSKYYRIINNGITFLNSELSKLSDIEAPEGIKLNQILITADEKGNLIYKLNGNEIGGSTESEEETPGNQEVNAYIGKVKKELEKNPAIQAIKKVKAGGDTPGGDGDSNDNYEGETPGVPVMEPVIVPHNDLPPSQPLPYDYQNINEI